MKYDIETKLKRIIIKNSKKQVSEDEINDRTNLINDFGYDSVQMIDFIVDVESEYNIRIDDEDLDLGVLTQYNTLKDFINRKMEHNNNN